MKSDLQLIQFLAEFLSERRSELINTVVDNRTYYITVLLDDIFQSQNASAVLRTCDCTGIQDLHVIENRNRYHYNPGVAMGAGKWVDIHRYSGALHNSMDAVRVLRSRNYRIITTLPGAGCTSLDDFDITKGKFAVVIGSEIGGVSREIVENADECLTIPMFGFTDSYNLSVSAAIILYTLMQRLKGSTIDWHLTDEEKNDLKFKWIKSSLKKPDLLIKKYREMQFTGSSSL